MEIINQQLKLYAMYGECRSARNYCQCYMKRVWLRMGSEDFINVEKFLERELKFIQNNNFDYLSVGKKITEFYGNDVYIRAGLGTTFDEATRQMHFWIQTDKNEKHDLPYIHYGIMQGDSEKVCYIFGVQNYFFRQKVSSINRALYKLNKNIENKDIPPSRIFVLTLFLDFLKENNITHIKVPLLQVLNYDYHILQSENIRNSFFSKWNKKRIEEFPYLRGFLLKCEIIEYENDQIEYIRFVDKQDLISKIKTENLFQLFMEIAYHNLDFELINDLDNNDGCLEFQWNQKRKLK